MPLPNKTKIPLGTILAGKYKVTREIGRGGMAAVYEAANVDIGKRVAIKVLAQELTTSTVVVERFLREARAAAAIRSPYICDIYDSGKLDDGRPFLVLELLEGESLYERMTKIRWLDIETTLTIITQVCRGLTKAHAANIVHRDLKPENIFLTKDEEGHLLSKIVDFGLAKFYSSMENEGPQARLTREGAVFGTPAYMSPEQVRGQGAVDQRADLWALGCIVYECFTGRTVWSTEQGVAMTFAQIANAELPRPAVYRPDLPTAFTTWFDRALDRDIAKRFQTAKEFADAFAGVFDKSLEISVIKSARSLLGDRSSLGDNPFVSSSDATSAPAPVSIVPSGGSRQVAADAVTEPPPARASAPVGSAPLPSAPGIPVDLASSPSHPSHPRTSVEPGGRPSGEPAPASPRPSKLGFSKQDGMDAGRRGSRPFTRALLVLGGLALAGGLGYLAWTQFLQAPQRTNTTPSASASSSANGPPVDSASATPSDRPPVVEAPVFPWLAQVREAQTAIAAGNLTQATVLLKDALNKSGAHGIPRTMLEHVGQAMGTKGPCKLAGLGRPRAYDLGSSSAHRVDAGRPTIVVGPHGPVVTWNDAHTNVDHVWAAALDDALRDTGPPVDVTPERVLAMHPDLELAGNKLVLVYTEAKGTEAGVHARFLDADGHIGGPEQAITAAKLGSFWPAVTHASNGGFFVAWTDEGDADSDDLFYRRLGPTLEPAADVVRATDLAGPPKSRARYASIAVVGDALFIDFRLEHDPNRLIEELRVPLADADKGLAPLPASARKTERKDRFIGDAAVVNTDKSRADAPSLACGGSGGTTCFVAWHVEQNGGAWAASLDPASTKMVARWRVTRGGGHPAVAVSPGGGAQVVWFEGAKTLLTAPLTRDGVGTPSRVAWISGGEAPTPSIAAGAKPGEWYVAWLVYEASHLEPYVARVQCK